MNKMKEMIETWFNATDVTYSIKDKIKSGFSPRKGLSDLQKVSNKVFLEKVADLVLNNLSRRDEKTIKRMIKAVGINDYLREGLENLLKRERELPSMSDRFIEMDKKNGAMIGPVVVALRLIVEEMKKFIKEETKNGRPSESSVDEDIGDLFITLTETVLEVKEEVEERVLLFKNNYYTSLLETETLRSDISELLALTQCSSLEEELMESTLDDSFSNHHYCKVSNREFVLIICDAIYDKIATAGFAHIEWLEEILDSTENEYMKILMMDLIRRYSVGTISKEKQNSKSYFRMLRRMMYPKASTTLLDSKWSIMKDEEKELWERGATRYNEKIPIEDTKRDDTSESKSEALDNFKRSEALDNFKRSRGLQTTLKKIPHVTLRKNRYGNFEVNGGASGDFEHPSTHLVFDRESHLVIGKQKDDQIVPLTAEDIEVCKENSFNIKESKEETSIVEEKTTVRRYIKRLVRDQELANGSIGFKIIYSIISRVAKEYEDKELLEFVQNCEEYNPKHIVEENILYDRDYEVDDGNHYISHWPDLTKGKVITEKTKLILDEKFEALKVLYEDMVPE